MNDFNKYLDIVKQEKFEISAIPKQSFLRDYNLWHGICNSKYSKKLDLILKNLGNMETKNEKIVTEKEIKEKRKESIKKEHFLFKLLIMLGGVSYYKVTYNKFHGFRKTYRVRPWHPLVWVFILIGIIISIPKTIIEGLMELKNDFKEQTYYC